MHRSGITFDTGALTAIEGGSRRLKEVVRYAYVNGEPVIVPAVVVIEWWRGGHKHRSILERCIIEPTTEAIAKAAGEAIAALGATPIDAAVMASAAMRGDTVFTSDVDDLTKLQPHFPGVTVLRA